MMEQDDNLLLQIIKQSLQRIVAATDDERQRAIIKLAIQRIDDNKEGDKQQ